MIIKLMKNFRPWEFKRARADALALFPYLSEGLNYVVGTILDARGIPALKVKIIREVLQDKKEFAIFALV